MSILDYQGFLPLHDILEDRRAKSYDGVIDHLCNGIVVENPTELMDCTPDNGFENFQRLVNGDALVYGEIANSTPFDGHVVRKGFERLVMKSARTTCVFSERDILMMLKGVVGVGVVKRHDTMGVSNVGEVICAARMESSLDGEPYCTLCVLCWIDGSVVRSRMDSANGLLYLSFGINIDKETCCVCGASSSISSPCSHVMNERAQSICVFRSFNSIEISDCSNSVGMKVEI